MSLLEERSLGEIAEFFETVGIRILVHLNRYEPSNDELRRMSSEARRYWRRTDLPTHWAALTKLDGSVIARWYGSGYDDEDATRSAARRYRIEQIGSEAEHRPPGDRLP